MLNILIRIISTECLERLDACLKNKNDVKMLSECLTLVGKPVKQFLVIFNKNLIFEKKIKFEKKQHIFEGHTSDLCKSSIRNWRHLWYPSLSMSNG